MSYFRVTLLGTGTPIPVPDRFGPSTLVEAGDQKVNKCSVFPTSLNFR
jgi:ribonuclease Z